MLDQSFTDAIFHLGKFVAEYQNSVLEIIMNEDTALIHLIPRDIYEGLEDTDEYEDY